MWKGYLFSIKGLGKGCIFSQTDTQKGEGLDLGSETPCIELCIEYLTPGLEI